MYPASGVKCISMGQKGSASRIWGRDIWSKPLNYVTMCLYYNKELLKAEGITPPSVNGEVWTWDEYVENAKRLTVDMSGKNAFQDGI